MIEYNKGQLGRAAKELGFVRDTFAIDRLTFSKIRRDLFPVLRKKDNFDLERRKKDAKEFIGQLMCLIPEEKEYLKAFEEKVYKPELLLKLPTRIYAPNP